MTFPVTPDERLRPLPGPFLALLSALLVVATACEGAPGVVEPTTPGTGGGGGTVEPPNCGDDEGCACDPESGPVTCYLDPASLPSGAVLCQAGTRTCRGGRWGACENLAQYTLELPKSLGQQSICNVCNPLCFEQTSTPTGSDLTGDNCEGVVYDATAPGLTVETSEGGGTTPLVDTDADGVPDLIDDCPGAGWRTPCDGSATIATEGFAFALPEGASDSDPYPTFSLTLSSVDYYVLIDTTTSMTDEIEQLQDDLITGNFLGATPPAGCSAATHPGILGAIRCKLPDTAFGIGMTREYPRNSGSAEQSAGGSNSTPTPGADDIPFIHLLDMTTDFDLAQTMVDALDINSQGYAQWYPEATGQALYSLATGLGLGPWVPTRGACANGGSGYACFRDGSVPVILVITDAPIHGGPSSGHPTGTYYPYGSWATTPNANVPVSALDLPAAITEDVNGRTVQEVLDLGNSAEFDLGNLTSRSVTVLGTTEESSNTNNFSTSSSLRDVCYGQGRRAPYFKFTLSQARTIRIDTNGSEFDSILALLTKSGSTYSRYNNSSSSCNDDRSSSVDLVSPENHSLYPEASYLRFTNLPAGTYYIAVDEKGTSDVRGAFQLRIWNENVSDRVASEATAVPWQDTVDALNELGAKTIGIAVCDGAPSPTNTQCPDALADLRILGTATDSVDSSGNPFVTLGKSDGTGLSTAVVDATLDLANHLRLDVGVKCIDDPGTAVDECALFAVQGIPAGGACPVTCTGGKDGNMCLDCAPGTAMDFTIQVTNVGVAQTPEPQVFEFDVALVAEGTTLSTQPVRVVVPGYTAGVASDGWFEMVYHPDGCNLFNQRADWGDLDYDLDLPAGTRVDIELRTASTLAGLATADVVTVTTQAGSLAADPLDIGATLVAAGERNYELYVSVRFHLYSNDDGTAAPVLQSFTTEYQCFDFD